MDDYTPPQAEPRRALLVGSLPFDDEEEAMREALDHLGPVLRSLPDGEVGEVSEQYPKGDRSAWVQTISDRCEADTENWKVVRPTKRNADGFYVDYDSGPRLKPRHRPKRMAEHLDLGWSEFARSSYPLFVAARAASGYDHLRFQVGLPTALGMTFGMMSPVDALRYGTAFNRRLAVEANEILDATGPDDVTFQLEVPGELALAYKLPSAAVGIATRTVIDLVERVRPEARFGVHLCFGDLNNEALIHPPSLDKMVNFINKLVDQWPSTHQLDYVHVPLAEAVSLPSTDPAWYAPLADIRLPGPTRFVAGIVHEGLDDDQIGTILGIIDGLRGGRVDVASSCGLGRRDTDTARSLLAATSRLTSV